MVKIAEYIDAEGKSAYRASFMKLDADTAVSVINSLTRIENGNISGLKTVGGEVLEYKVDSGRGYRIYMAWDADDIVILSGDEGVQRVKDEVERAKELWKEYKTERKKKKKL